MPSGNVAGLIAIVLVAGLPPPPPQFTVQVLAATVIGAVELLFAELGSFTAADSLTAAELVMVVPETSWLTVAVMTKIAEEPACMSPIAQIPVEAEYVPKVDVAPTNVMPEGNTSVAVTPVDVAGPIAETVTV